MFDNNNQQTQYQKKTGKPQANSTTVHMYEKPSVHFNSVPSILTSFHLIIGDFKDFYLLYKFASCCL